MDMQMLKKRRLDSYYLVINQVKTQLKVEYEGTLCTKNLYCLFGVNLVGKRMLLAYGIDYKESSEFWLDMFRDIKSRGIQKVKYMTIIDTDNSVRAAKITFSGIKLFDSPFILIDKVQPYFPERYVTKIPNHIKDLFLQVTVNDYQEQLETFKLNYENQHLVLLLLENDLVNIVKVYEIDYNTRQLLFATYFNRDFKKRIKIQINKGLDQSLDDIISCVFNVSTQERSMCVTKAKFMKILEINFEDIRGYL